MKQVKVLKLYLCRMEYRIVEIIQEAPRVRRFVLQPEHNSALNFIPGQFIVLQMESPEHGIIQRSYSISSKHANDQYLELCIAMNDNGVFTPWLFKQEEGFWIVGSEPQGNFTFLDGQARVPHMFICTGTGVAPFRSMISKALKLEDTPVYLVFGNRFSEDILYHEEWKQLAQQNQNFHYHPVLSRQNQSFAHTGYVHPVYTKILEKVNDAQIYVCGWQNMLVETRKNLKALGFNRKQYHFEQYD